MAFSQEKSSRLQINESENETPNISLATQTHWKNKSPRLSVGNMGVCQGRGEQLLPIHPQGKPSNTCTLVENDKEKKKKKNLIGEDI